MAHDQDLKFAAREVAYALHKFARDQTPPWRFAKEKDFTQGDYYIDIVVNADWFRIYVTFVASGFRNRDRFERFKEVQDYLRERFHDNPSFLHAITLIVRDPEQYLAEGDFPPGVSDKRLDEDFVEKYLGTQITQS